MKKKTQKGAAMSDAANDKALTEAVETTAGTAAEAVVSAEAAAEQQTAEEQTAATADAATEQTADAADAQPSTDTDKPRAAIAVTPRDTRIIHSSRLDRCPVCGGEAVIRDLREGTRYIAQCSNAKCALRTTTYDRSSDDALRSWNNLVARKQNEIAAENRRKLYEEKRLEQEKNRLSLQNRIDSLRIQSLNRRDASRVGGIR